MRIDTRALRKFCRTQRPPGEEIAKGLWFIDNSADILGIAHLDYVPQTNHFDFVLLLPSRERVIYSGQLDDRLGVYTLLDVLKMSGCKFDVLLTTDEEKCKSTARQFYTDKVYRWIFSFDRAGSSDVAVYGYYDENVVSAVQSVGLRAAHGSYSDIVELEHLGCKGFNWCTGLQDGHSPFAHVRERDYLSCVLRFLDFWELYSETHFPHTRFDKSPWAHDDFDICEWCGEYSAEMVYMSGAWICPACGAEDKWIDECLLCGQVTITEYVDQFDAWLCESCAKMLKGG